MHAFLHQSLPPGEPDVLKTTDEGPLRCPELSNTEVKFSDDEMARFLNFDPLNRVHRVWNVIRKNESVRSR